MLLTIATERSPARDLGYLLHKRPDRVQTFDLSFGKAHVFYPQADDRRCEAALLLDVDRVGMVRGKSESQGGLLDQYVNDRPYVASSFLSVAIAQVYGSAMGGRCKDRPELVGEPMSLEATIEVLPVRGGEPSLRRLFEPLGYELSVRRHPLDVTFPEWGGSPYFSVKLTGTTTLSRLLTHLYVLMPVFDERKHYFVGEAEIEKLLAKGDGWLAAHPAREEITRRYLGRHPSLYRQALARLVDEMPVEDEEASAKAGDAAEEALEKPKRLNDTRHETVAEALRTSGAKSVLDLGCGEGRLLRELVDDKRFERLAGLDVSVRALENAKRRLKVDRLPEAKAKRLEFLHGSLVYRDRRMEGFDAAAAVEVIEHLDPPRLAAFERVVFEFAKPKTVIVTTPNREYNVTWPSLPAGRFRHPDHRFEWTRHEFETWATAVAARYGYRVRFACVGPEDAELGSPTQMGVFES